MSESFDLEVTMDDLQDSAPTIPAGDYHLKIVKAEAKETAEGGGQFFSYTAVVQAGEYAGEYLFGFWTIKPAAGKKDFSFQTKGDWKRLGLSGTVRAADLVGIEGYAKVTEGPVKDRTTKEPTGERENRIKSWTGTV